MVEKMISRWYLFFGLVMLIGMVHTIMISSTKGESITYHLNGIKVSSSVPRISPKKIIYLHPKVIYSPRDILLAKLIKERFNYSNYDQDLLIAQCINKDTKGLAWPTPLAVASIIEIESQYNSHAVSDCGAKGLMQISPIWSHQVPPQAYTSIKENIKYGVQILNSYYRRYDGNKMAAILSYNSGNNAYNKGQAWPTYWWRYKDAKIAFDTLYQQSV